MPTPSSPYPLLDSLAAPQQVRHFTPAQLEQLAAEVRAFLIASVSETGGHFSSNLGTVELTVKTGLVNVQPWASVTTTT